MPDKPRNKQASNSWWADEQVRRLLLKTAHSSLGFLIVHFHNLREDRWYSAVFSGFFLVYRDQSFWMTAGHVITQLQEMTTDRGLHIQEVLMRDGHPPADMDASCLPIALDPASMFGIDLGQAEHDSDSGFDFGMLALRPIYAANLANNPGTTFFPAEDSMETARQSGGLYVIGAPCERVLKTNGTNLRLEVHCLPIKQLGQCPPHLSNCRHAIYGQLVQDGDDPIWIDSIKGMSGGPVFAVEHRAKGKFGFRLVGIQSAWHRPSRTVRISPVRAMLEAMDKAIGVTSDTISAVPKNKNS